MISGRPISTFHLLTPLVYQDREIYLVELPSPKANSPYPTGWEHAEFVIDTDLDTFIGKYRDIDWDL
jgi:predicted metalloenzyme YecM